jgi:hypothetical protein
MRISLQNQPQIDQLSGALGQALRTLVAGIQTIFGVEHKGGGAHAAVTADSVAVTGTTTLHKLNLAQAEYVEPGATGGTVNDLTCANIAQASCLRIVAASSPLIINGIDATGRTPGDLLLVLNCDDTLAPKDVWLATEATASAAGNRFAETTASPGGGAGGPVIINGARGIWLCYDYQRTNPLSGTPLPRWRVIDPGA